MEPVKVTKWRAADGELYDTEAEAAAIDQRVWRERVADVMRAGGKLIRPYNPNVIAILDFLLNKDTSHRRVIHCNDNSLYDEQFMTLYIWQASTEEQANLIATALSKHELMSQEFIDELIVKNIFTKYLGRTMVIQKSTSTKAYAMANNTYRVIDGLDKIMLQFRDSCAYIEKMLYRDTTPTEGDSEK